MIAPEIGIGLDSLAPESLIDLTEIRNNAMNKLLPCLSQLCEIQKLDIALSGSKDELRRIQRGLILIRKEILARETALEGEKREQESIMESRKQTLEEMGSKILKNLNTVRQYETQLKTEKRRPVVELLQRGTAKMRAENELFEMEGERLRNEMPELEQKFLLRTAYLQQSLDEFKVRSKEQADELELEEIGVTLGIDDVGKKRAEKAGLISAEIVAEYERLKANAHGFAIATVDEQNSCSACRIQVRAQTIVELKSKKAVVCCENCGRILWFYSGRRD